MIECVTDAHKITSAADSTALCSDILEQNDSKSYYLGTFIGANNTQIPCVVLATIARYASPAIPYSCDTSTQGTTACPINGFPRRTFINDHASTCDYSKMMEAMFIAKMLCHAMRFVDAQEL